MTINHKLLSLTLVTVIALAACGKLEKPELKPQIYTSAPHATNLRSATTPDEMMAYDSLEAIRQAWLDLDSNLGDLDGVPILEPGPLGMTPSFSANPEEVVVSYLDKVSSQKSITIYGYFSDNPQTLLEDFSESTYFETTQIGDNEFHLLTEQADDSSREAYTIKDQWFLHIFAEGFSEAEFNDILDQVTLAPFF